MTAKQLRLKTSQVLKKVQQTGFITVTVRGKPVAKLVSLSAHEERVLTDYPAFGMWANRKDIKRPVAWVRKIRRPRYSLQ